MAATEIMSAENVRRTITRLAYEIIERNRGAENIEIAGIRTRGTLLAELLAQKIQEVERREITVNRLDVEPYRDDRDPSEPVNDTSEVHVDFADRDLILVDDVLYTGRTVRAAMDAAVRFGRPRSIQLAVLIDRGHREVPIQPDYTGRLIPTKHQERVVLRTEDAFSVVVEE